MTTFSMVTRTTIFARFLRGAVPILLVGTGIWFFAFYYLYSEETRLTEIRLLSHEMSLQAVELNEEGEGFLLEDVINPEFYLSDKGEHRESHHKHLEIAKNALNGILQLQPKSWMELPALSDKLEKYDQLFNRLVSTYRERGFGEWGMEGKVNSSRKRLQQAAHSSHDAKIENLLSEASEAELQYLYRDEPAYIVTVSTTLQKLEDAAKARRAKPMLSLLKEHQEAFDTYVHLDQKIGLKRQNGMRQELDALFNSIEEQAIRNYKGSAEQAQLAVRQMIYISGAALVLIVLSEIFALYFVARSISVPITALTDAVTRVRNGQSDIEIKENSRDEVGTLATAFREMFASLDKTQRQLFQAQKLEAIGTLAGGIAHDFNNLLGGILAYAGLIKKRLSADVQTVNELEIIERSAERGAELTKQLLGYARKGSYEKKKFDLTSVVIEARKLLYRTLDKTITVKADFAKGLDQIEGDSGQILQALMNLGINAKDAMPEGGELWFETQNMAADQHFCDVHGDLKPGRYVRVSVTDTGSGIPKELQSKIYDPFFTTKEVGKGTGLGLSMVYGIMQNHHGSISVYSELGKGTCFHLYFPAVTAIGIPVSLPPAREVSHADTNRLGGQMIISVDDEQLMRNLARDVLEPEGATLFFASNGEEALEFLRKNHAILNLVILDVIMPKMDGVKVYLELRKFAPNLPVVLASGYAESEAITKLRQEDNNVNFIQKPFRSELLIEAVINSSNANKSEKWAA